MIVKIGKDTLLPTHNGTPSLLQYNRVFLSLSEYENLRYAFLAIDSAIHYIQRSQLPDVIPEEEKLESGTLKTFTPTNVSRSQGLIDSTAPSQRSL